MKKEKALILILTLLLAVSLSYNTTLITSGNNSSVKIKETLTKIEINATWDRIIELNLIYPETEDVMEEEGVIDFTIYLNVITPKEAEDLVFDLYVYEMTSKGLKLLHTDKVKRGINKVTFKLPYKLLSRKVVKEFIKEPWKKVGAIILNRTKGVSYKFIPVYKAVNIMFHVVKFNRAIRKWCFGALPLPLTPLNMSQTFDIRVKKVCSEPVSEDQVPAPGQNHNKVRSEKIYACDSLKDVYVKTTPSNPLPLHFPVKIREYTYNPYEDQWYRGSWYEPGTSRVDATDVQSFSGKDLHFIVKADIRYTYVSSEYMDPPYRIIVEEVYASEFLRDYSTTWTTSSGGGILTTIAPGGSDTWKAYKSTQLSIELVSLTFTVISIKGKPIPIPIPKFRFKIKQYGIDWYVRNDASVTIIIYNKHAEAFIKITKS